MSSDRIIDEVFNKAAAGKPLIKNRSVLRADYVPDRLLFRDQEIKALAEALTPLLKGARASNLFLYGQTGTGKTVVAKHVLKRLQERGTGSKTKIALAYSNTKTAEREYTVLVELGGAIGLRFPFTGLASSEVFSRIVAHIEAQAINTVFVLDEIDFLVKKHGDETLYQMTRANERLKKGSLGLIGISNDLNFKDLLDPRVLSSLSEEEIVFHPYTVQELREILRERLREGFHKGCVSDAVVNLCAAVAGQEHGDARRAVDLLRVAGEVAEREGANIVGEKHVRVAEKKIEQDKVSETLRSLPVHQKLVILGVMGSQKGSSGDVFESYLALSRKLGLEPVTQRRIGMIINELNMQGLVSAPVVSQGRYGRTKKTTLAVQPSIVKQVFGVDPVIAPLL